MARAKPQAVSSLTSSIAAYKAEEAAIRTQFNAKWDAAREKLQALRNKKLAAIGNKRRKPVHANSLDAACRNALAPLEAKASKQRERLWLAKQGELDALLDACRKRHFPGLVLGDRTTVDSPPQLWAYLKSYLMPSLALVDTSAPKNQPHDAASKYVSEAYGLLHSLGVPWAPPPPYELLTVAECMDVLRNIVHRLEADDLADKVEVEGNKATHEDKGNGGRQAPTPSAAALPHGPRMAYFSYLYATQQMERDVTDDDAHAFLKENGIDGSALSGQEYDLPSNETWKRELRMARSALGEQKNSRRVGRTHGKSIVKARELAPRRRED